MLRSKADKSRFVIPVMQNHLEYSGKYSTLQVEYTSLVKLVFLPLVDVLKYSHPMDRFYGCLTPTG